ncbi:MAG: hypothetical protein M1837_006942 [Sclerophora amabilis]|nr:MAG: hypothetical protein M1837_006942 [Sclerophora amabilis]
MVQAWLNSFLSSQQRTAPLPALKQTALFRLLQSDITTSIQQSPNSVFPLDISNGQVQERRVAGPIPVQILSIEDIAHSRWSQVEALEAEERGEKTKGREIIRVVPGEEEEDNTSTHPASTGPHKLILQDARGTSVYAVELFNIHGIDMNTSIGVKLILKDVLVARGVLLLEPKNVTFLGGKIEELQKKWKDGRKEALKTAARESSSSSG